MNIKNELDFGEVLRELQDDGMISSSKVRVEFESIINKAVELLSDQEWSIDAPAFVANEAVTELFDKICHGEEVELDEIFDDLIGSIENIFWELDMGDDKGVFDGGWRSHFNWEF